MPASGAIKLADATQANSPSHALWTDAYLAAFAMETQAQFATFDEGFSRFAGLDLLVLSH